jgi:exonuclease III
MQAVRIASLNINGATAAAKLDMLTDFLYRQEITIILLQKVTHNDGARIRGYDTYLNRGATLRGTALAVEKTTRIQQVQPLPSGRAIAAKYEDLRIVNIYAPSGTSNRVERKHFYNSELPNMMRHTPGTLLLGGDFNCTQTAAETTGQPCPSRALSELIRRMDLKDTWSYNYNQTVYTLHTHWREQTRPRICF